MKKFRVVIFTLIVFLCFSGYLSAEPRRYQGKPVFRAGMVRRYIIWEEEGVFKLRTTTKEMLKIFTGVIYADEGVFTDIKLIRLDTGDYVKLSNNKKKLYFSFSTHKGVDGFNFTTNAKRLVFHLLINNRKAAKKLEVFLGANGIHPFNNPFLLFMTGSNTNDEVPADIDVNMESEGEEVTAIVPDSELEAESKVSD